MTRPFNDLLADLTPSAFLDDPREVFEARALKNEIALGALTAKHPEVQQVANAIIKLQERMAVLNAARLSGNKSEAEVWRESLAALLEARPLIGGGEGLDEMIAAAEAHVRKEGGAA